MTTLTTAERHPKGATFHVGRDLSPNRLKDGPRYTGAGRMLLSTAVARDECWLTFHPVTGAGGTLAEATSHRTKCSCLWRGRVRPAACVHYRRQRAAAARRPRAAPGPRRGFAASSIYLPSTGDSGRLLAQQQDSP